MPAAGPACNTLEQVAVGGKSWADYFVDTGKKVSLPSSSPTLCWITENAPPSHNVKHANIRILFLVGFRVF